VKTQQEAIKAIADIMDNDFDHCEESTLRAELFKLSEAIWIVRAGLIFSPLADQFRTDSIAEVEFLHALCLLETAAMGIKKAALRV